MSLKPPGDRAASQRLNGPPRRAWGWTARVTPPRGQRGRASWARGSRAEGGERTLDTRNSWAGRQAERQEDSVPGATEP